MQFVVSIRPHSVRHIEQEQQLIQCTLALQGSERSFQVGPPVLLLIAHHMSFFFPQEAASPPVMTTRGEIEEFSLVIITGGEAASRGKKTTDVQYVVCMVFNFSSSYLLYWVRHTGD